MSFRVYKTVKALTQLVGAAGGIFAMHLGADPLLAFSGVVAMVLGPEGFEYWITNVGGSEQPSELDRALEDSELSAQDVVDELEAEDR